MNPLHSRPILYTLVLAALLLGGAKLYVDSHIVQPSPSGPPPPPAPDPAIAAFIKSTEAALRTGNFDRLEQEAQTDRNPDSRFAGGYSKLRYFYRSLGSFGRHGNCGCGKIIYNTDLTFGQKLHAIRTWLAEKPNSTAAAIAMAELWNSLGWNARGHDYVDETPPQSLDLFQKRLAVAATYLDPLTPTTDPAIYDVKFDLLRGIGDGRDDMATLYPQAIQVFPSYYVYYGAMAGLLEPRWFGQPGDLRRFLGLLAAPESGDTNRVAYSFAAEALIADYGWDEIFTQTGLDWPALKRSFALRAQKYGSSLKLLNVELEFATAAKDQHFAAQLIQQIGTKWDPNVWRDWGSFAGVAAWAKSG